MEYPEKQAFVAEPNGRRSHGKATLADVATLAGVTTMTVSRLLREPQSVKEETAARIRLALQETNYAPNKQAGVLASGRSAIVAALIPSIANSVFAESIQGLSDVLEPAGLELMLASSGYSLEREENQLRTLLGWAPAAVVVTGRHHSVGSVNLLRRARDCGTPVIEIWDHDPKSAEFIQIGFNHHQAGQIMAAHLLACGWDNLMYLDSGIEQDYRARERGQGFLDACRQASAKCSRRTAKQVEPMAAGRLVIQNMPTSKRPQAIAFANDHLAVGALLQARDESIVVPENLALLGFGDFPIACQFGGGISTLTAPRYQIGQESGRCILSRLRPKASIASTALTSICLNPNLTIRGSTRQPNPVK